MLPTILPDALPFWAGVAALVALIYTAVVDARTGLVPPIPLLMAGLITVLGWYLADPASAPAQILFAFIAYAAIWSLNMAWRTIYKHDALGMGDASWTCLATLAYGWPMAVAAWGEGAILALLFLAIRKAMGKPATHVYFAPFLCVSLIVAQLLKPFVLS